MHTLNEYSTLSTAMNALRDKGFKDEFEYKDGHLVSGDRQYSSDQLSIVEHHRFEGVSDPGDMSVLYAIEAKDGTKGQLVDGYGTYAEQDLASFIKQIELQEPGAVLDGSTPTDGNDVRPGK